MIIETCFEMLKSSKHGAIQITNPQIFKIVLKIDQQICTKSNGELIVCTPIILKNPIQADFSKRNILFIICSICFIRKTGILWIIKGYWCTKYISCQKSQLIKSFIL